MVGFSEGIDTLTYRALSTTKWPINSTARGQRAEMQGKLRMSKLQKDLGQGAGTVIVFATLAMPGTLQALEGQIVPGASRMADVSATERLHALPHQLGESPDTGIHGQILFGLNSLMMMYLPVFMSLAENHSYNFQVIVEVAFENPAHLERYRADRMAHADEIYTAVPTIFDQSALVLEHEGRESLRRWIR